MNRVTNSAEECNRILPASTKTADSTASISRGASNGDCDLDKKLEESRTWKTPIHFVSRSIAREHGWNEATVLTGFALKLRKHKHNSWKNRYWYYDPLSELVKVRWPYFSQASLAGYIDYLDEAALLLVDCHNKMSRDRTQWYSMEDAVRDAALSDLVWFDVRVAKVLGVRAGAIYHNLRFHLRKWLESNPEDQCPYHKLKKAQLARDLVMDVSTVDALMNEMIRLGFIAKNPSKKKLYTILNLSELVPNTGNLNSKEVKQNHGNLNPIMGNLNSNRGNLNPNTGNLNDITQLETSEKPIRNHSENVEYVSKKACAFGTVDETIHSSGHKIIPSPVASFPGTRAEHRDESPGGHYCGTDYKPTYDDILARNKNLVPVIAGLSESIRSQYKEYVSILLWEITHERITLQQINTLQGFKRKDALAQEFHPLVHDHLKRWIGQCSKLFALREIETWPLLYFPIMEALVNGILYPSIAEDARGHTINLLQDETFDCFDAFTERQETSLDLPAIEKSQAFFNSVNWHNKIGWDMADGTERPNLVQPTKKGVKAITAIFEKNPQLSAKQLLEVLWNCILINTSEQPPSGFDQYWHARQGCSLDKFAQYIEEIICELKMFEECPICAES